VKSDVPALILAGQFDPNTPGADSQQVAQALSHSTLVEIPGAGHGVLRPPETSCAWNITAAFLAAPQTKPDTKCVSSLSARFQ
jgi:pimeloyl-ACP methyl ester carboxylesterase